MQTIPPSTRPTEAINNAIQLLHIETACRQSRELAAWLTRARAEVLQLEKFSEEGSVRRSLATTAETRTHIDTVLTSLTRALTQLDARIELAEEHMHTGLDDWSGPTIRQVIVPAPARDITSDIPNTRQFWTWKPCAIVGGSIAGLAWVSSVLGGNIGPTEFLVFPGAVFIYMLVIGKIMSRAGYNGWLCLLYLVPIVNVLMLWMAAGSDWPVEKERNALRDRLESIESIRNLSSRL